MDRVSHDGQMIIRPVGSIRKVVRLVTGPKEIAARGSGGAL